MENSKSIHLLGVLKDLFDGEVIDNKISTSVDTKLSQATDIVIDDELKSFLAEREQVKDIFLQNMSLESYLQSYDELCRYGLDEYLMESLHWHIRNEMEDCAAQFFESDFYMRFKHYKTVNDIVITFDPDKFNN